MGLGNLFVIRRYELCMAIEPLFDTADERFGVSTAEIKVPDADLYTDNPNHPDEYDPQSTDEINDETDPF